MTFLPIIPLPQKAVLTGGVFHLNAHTRIWCDEAALLEGQGLAGALCRSGEAAVSLNAASSHSAPSIELRIGMDWKALGDEGYCLSVTCEGIAIHAAARSGLFYGIQTLLQLLPASFYDPSGTESSECSIACVEIEDSPRFAWRGAMLDVARHFLPKEFVLKFIDLLALHKMNVLHLHLTDDQGWRIEIKKYPRLTSVGAVREKTLVGRALANPTDSDFDPAAQRFDGLAHAGCYTQEQAREIVAYAAARHIIVVPEIEMPGHAQAAITAYPFLGCGDAPMEVSPRWGIHDALYKPSERTLEFLQDVLVEVMEIFPSRYIHIGGDEAIKTQWRASQECQAIKRALGLPDEEAMQSYFIGRMDKFLTEQGRVLVGWDEILEGGLSPGAVVMSWRGEEGGVEAARQGHDVVMAPEQYTYFDHYQSKDRDAEPLAFSELLTLSTVYGYEPIPADLPQEYAHHVRGAQCQLWTEYMPTTGQVEYMAFPRMAALAEVTWSSRESRDYGSFIARLPYHLTRLDALGVNYRPLTLK